MVRSSGSVVGLGVADRGVGGEAGHVAHGEAPGGGEPGLVGRRRGHVGEALVRDEGLGARVLQDVGHLGRHQVVVDGDEVPAGLEGGQVDLEHLGAVGQQRGDHVAHAEALGPQRVHQLVGPCPSSSPARTSSPSGVTRAR